LAWASPAVLGTSPQRRFYTGTNLDQAVTVEDLRAMAHRRLPGFVLEYLEAGGDDEATLARNIAALAEWRFLHCSLVDVSHRDVSTTLFGRKMTIPVIVAPTGLNELFWPHRSCLEWPARPTATPCCAKGKHRTQHRRQALRLAGQIRAAG
jgi:(S)-mandelate dehydrogenase